MLKKKFNVDLNIAGIIVRVSSRFPIEKTYVSKTENQSNGCFNRFIYTGNRKVNINVSVEVVDELPKMPNAEPVFITYHFQDRAENWRLYKLKESLVYSSPLEDKEQLMFINNKFNCVKAYLLPKKESMVEGKERKKFVSANNGYVWDIKDIVYDFLQVLLINYFAQRNSGMLVHAMAIKDIDGRGLLFCGVSGSGKSTLARIWHKYSRAAILNDDRIIINKINGKLYINSSPWHGKFRDYLNSKGEIAPFNSLFFIHHSPTNVIKRIPKKEALNLFYPILFPAFWDKSCLVNTLAYSEKIVERVPCFYLGVENDKKIINFIRKQAKVC